MWFHPSLYQLCLSGAADCCKMAYSFETHLNLKSHGNLWATHVSNRFKILHTARQCHYRALCETQNKLQKNDISRDLILRWAVSNIVLHKPQGSSGSVHVASFCLGKLPLFCVRRWHMRTIKHREMNCNYILQLPHLITDKVYVRLRHGYTVSFTSSIFSPNVMVIFSRWRSRLSLGELNLFS